MNNDKIISIVDFIQTKKKTSSPSDSFSEFSDFHWKTLTSLLPHCYVTKKTYGFRVDYTVMASEPDDEVMPFLPTIIPLFLLKRVDEDPNNHYGFDIYCQSNLANTILNLLQYLLPAVCWHCILDQYDKVSDEKRLIDMFILYLEEKDNV